MHIVSWNVNGIRAAIKKGFVASVQHMQPDILCIQETKAQQEQVDIHLPTLPYHYWYSAQKKGYSGTALFCKHKPLSVTRGIGHLLDDEGRVLTAEFETFYVVTVYTPNAKDDLSRLDVRHDSWDPQFLAYVQALATKKPVVFCGDLNVAHQDIDLARPDANRTTAKRPGNKGFTDKERIAITRMLDAGFIDTFRYLYPQKQDAYTWWSQMGGARARNVGWRIDYVFVSAQLKESIQDARIYHDIMGSDHCPVSVVLK
ncbi:MAG: exodeoxyribonuclease III [Candidatus Woesearchaeota archaeon]